MKRNNKTAISLIVLVITIIVLSILAATVIISLSNTNIMGQTSETVFKQDMANYKEAYEMYLTNKLAENANFDRNTLSLTYESEEYEKILGNVSDKYKEGLKVINGKLVYETEDEKEKAVLKELNMEVPLVAWTEEGVPIPLGFYYVGGAKDTGLVISDNATDKNRGVGEGDICIGNQFVWVPVDGYTKGGVTTSHQIYVGTDKARTVTLYNSFTNKFKTGTVDTSVTPYQMTSTLNMSNFTEPYNGYTNEEDEYYEMMESVQNYGGFYIGRFEAGKENNQVVCKQGVPVYNWVKWGDSMTSIGTTGAVYLSQHMYENHESVVSTLCYGVQWDAALNFVSDNDTHNISNSTSWGNYKNNTETGAGVLQKTGYSESWKAKNIYDLAGNVYEWTMEAISSYGRVNRGGYYDHIGSGGTASYRYNYYPDDANGSDGFRPTLYIVVE